MTFQHTAARRRLGLLVISDNPLYSFNTQPPEGGWLEAANTHHQFGVSTHSRPKAAGTAIRFSSRHCNGFNTQPPEGGWAGKPHEYITDQRFQHTAARRRLAGYAGSCGNLVSVSTHSRPKAAGAMTRWLTAAPAFQHTAARRRLVRLSSAFNILCRFQHTAARRRLDTSESLLVRLLHVSTHSRPKAAGFDDNEGLKYINRFNTQPPEGGWDCPRCFLIAFYGFNTQPPEGGWILAGWVGQPSAGFQHTAARRRLGHKCATPCSAWRFQHTAARRRLEQVTPFRVFELPVSTHSRPKAAGG